jgi:hypothetical protein
MVKLLKLVLPSWSDSVQRGEHLGHKGILAFGKAGLSITSPTLCPPLFQ